MKTGIGSGIGRGILLASSIVFLSQPGTALAQSDRSMFLEQYKGMPFQDSHYKTAPQRIPGRVECAAYDVGGESVAYHDSDAVNHGSGQLNPADGSYLNEFRMHDGVDISYTKFPTAPGKDAIDSNHYETVTPPKDQLYVGWTEPGEWFNITIDVAKAGKYTADLLFTSNRGGSISLDVNGHEAAGPVMIPTTYNDAEPIAWRQWHHWNIQRNAVTLDLPAGRNVLTVHILTGGNMNLAYFDFRPAAEK
jgi:Carbohydrate binding module (family 6)